MYDNMSLKEDRIRVNARIPKSMYDWICSEYDNLSQAVNDGLETLKESKAAYCHTESNKSQRTDIQDQNDIHAHTNINADVIPEQKARIEDMKSQVQELYEQLHTKDEQIEKLNENMHKQAVHIQSLIQENSRLNTKLLPEETGKKNPWWKFW
jgi:chromosome segregation ATPase